MYVLVSTASDFIGLFMKGLLVRSKVVTGNKTINVPVPSALTHVCFRENVSQFCSVHLIIIVIFLFLFVVLSGYLFILLVCRHCVELGDRVVNPDYLKALLLYILSNFIEAI